MFNSTISEKVSKFLERKRQTQEKINSKVSNIDNDMKKIRIEIGDKQDIFVKYDLADDDENKEKVQKYISGLNEKIINLEQRKAAFTKATTDDPEDKPEAVEIKKAAVKEISETWNKIQASKNKVKSIESEIKQLEVKKEAEWTNISNLNYTIDSIIPSEILKISKYLYSDEDLKEIHGNTKESLIKSDLMNAALYKGE
jgi:chromosome segregation ATPase